MLPAYRKEPEIDKTKSLSSHTKPDDERGSYVGALLFIVIAYFVLSAIGRVMSSSGSKLDQIVCYGTLICFVIGMLLEARHAHRESQARKAERQRWAKDCKTALLTIVSRQEASSWWDDLSYRYRYSDASLKLEMNSDQRAVSPNQTIVSAKVSDYIYKRLKECDTVRIYYMPESPLTFLLEEEL